MSDTLLEGPDMPAPRRLRRRLAPLYAAAFLQNVALWVPVEKLFLTSSPP